jgi:hypothetical protein
MDLTPDQKSGAFMVQSMAGRFYNTIMANFFGKVLGR